MKPRRGTAPKTVDEYITRLPPKFRSAIRQIRKVVNAAAPGAEEVISYGLPALRQNGMLVYYGAFSDHCSFFVGSATARRRFAVELESFKGGKGTLHFTPDHPLPAGLVTRVVKARVAENAARRAK